MKLVGKILGAMAICSGLGVLDIPAQENAAEEQAATLRIQGSDTMLQVNLKFAEQYAKEHPMKRVTVRGEGSSTGFRALVGGTADIGCSSRPIKDSEKAKIKEALGEDPVEHVVAYDTIAVFVHAKNSLDSTTVESLKEIFFEGGKIDRWDQIPGNEGSVGDIELLGLTKFSGTYAAFRTMVTASRAEYKMGTAAMAGSVALVEKLGSTPLAMGYTGSRYATEAVKALKLAPKPGDEPTAPTAENVRSGKYPLSRKFYYYTAGKPEGEAAKFIDWLKSDRAKGIIADHGFIAP